MYSIIYERDEIGWMFQEFLIIINYNDWILEEYKLNLL